MGTQHRYTSNSQMNAGMAAMRIQLEKLQSKVEEMVEEMQSKFESQAHSRRS
jgi:hypothetical protein